MSSVHTAFLKPCIHLEGKTDQITEGIRAVANQEVFHRIIQSPVVDTVKGSVIPTALRGQDSELQCVVRHRARALVESEQTASSSLPVCWMVKHSPELIPELEVIKGENWVIFNG